jgi:hypothetical protein
MLVKRIVAERQGWKCLCGCNQTLVFVGARCTLQWDHHPALRLRQPNVRGTDYVPGQNDPDYIVARCRDSHARKTHGTGATTAGSDIGAIKKERKVVRPEKTKRAWSTRKTRWPKRRFGQ